MTEVNVYTFNMLHDGLSGDLLIPVSYVLLSEYNKQMGMNATLRAENAELKKQIEELYTELKELNRETAIHAQQSMLQAELDVLNKKIQMRASKRVKQ